MKFIDVEQGSPGWLNLRLGKITATEVPILLKSNPFKTKLELWEQKLQLREPDEVNEKMTRGSKLEEPARLLLCELLGIDFKPAVVINDTHPYLMASLDGLSPCNRFICEIKCPSSNKKHELAISNVIPMIYIDQIQTQLLVTGCEKCYYCSYFPGHDQEIVIIDVYPDLDKQQHIIEISWDFYVDMCTMNEPIEWKMK